MRLFLSLIFLYWSLVYCFAKENNDMDNEWELWKYTHRKNYSEIEDSLRRQVWEENLKLINDHNAMYNEGKTTYEMQMNFFGDMTDDEYQTILFAHMPRKRRSYMPLTTLDPSDLPKSVDWREKGYVTPVRHQGRCGSCWIFGVIGALEGQLFRKTGKLVELSKQQLMDCPKPKIGSCRGGYSFKAYKYLLKHNFIHTEECYPYMAKEKQECFHNPKCTIPINMKSIAFIPPGNEQRLKHALATVGPVTVSINALPSFRFYKSGIYSDPKCSKRINHTVLVVGYGYENNADEENKSEKKYWIIKNSWGKHWGEGGYIRITRDRHNFCGIASHAMYPVL